MGNVELVVLQGTPFCNIACRYCYLPDRNNRQSMRQDTLEQICRRLIEYGHIGGTLNIVWHSGEPLVLPPSFYRQALITMKKVFPPDLHIKQVFQTNGTLVSDEWCDFFQEAGCRIGISIDGPPRFNKERVTRKGEETSSRVANGVEKLRANNIPFYVLAVLTSVSLEHPEELYDYFADIGTKEICFNVEEIKGINRTTSMNGDVEVKLAQFFRRFWNRQVKQGRFAYIRELDDAMRQIVAPSGSQVNNVLCSPLSIISFDWLGNFSTFSPELIGQKADIFGNFQFGNVSSHKLSDIFESVHFRTVLEQIEEGVGKCQRDCEYFSVCGGGTPVNKFNETGSFSVGPTTHCRLSKMLPMQIALEIAENTAVEAIYGTD